MLLELPCFQMQVEGRRQIEPCRLFCYSRPWRSQEVASHSWGRVEPLGDLGATPRGRGAAAIWDLF